MTHRGMTYQELWRPLTAVYEPREAQAVARLVLERRYGLSLADVLGGAVETLQREELEALQERLLKGEPVQYVLGEAEFFGRWFYVEPGVLIPRPETEELCRLMIASTGDDWRGTILDIGTGSGCIAVTLAAELPTASVTAWDISPEALAVARRNVSRHDVLTHAGNGVDIRQGDALNPPPDRDAWDVIISNPPYVCEQERGAMERNVLEHEPALALFVPDDDPLRFYRAIGRYATGALKSGGRLFFELNTHYVDEACTLLSGLGFADIKSHQDQFGRNRFISACKREAR